MVKEGKLRRIGISNYTIEDYEELKKEMTIKVRAASGVHMTQKKCPFLFSPQHPLLFPRPSPW
jgi:predicted oxidoreductase